MNDPPKLTGMHTEEAKKFLFTRNKGRQNWPQNMGTQVKTSMEGGCA